jgi:hypothetical protein
MKKTILHLLLSSLTATGILLANEQPRILELLPGLLAPLAIEPAIPANFTAMSPTGALDPAGWIYWGPEASLKTYFQNPKLLKEPLLSVSLSGNVKQTSPDGFGPEAKQALDMMKAIDPKGFTSFKTNWGPYPVQAVKVQMEGHTLMMAWVGLNSPEGWTLLFNFVYPDQKGRPDKKDMVLWENFLKNTKPLTDGDFFKAHGQDMQEGSTSVNYGGAKYRLIAEKRESDGMIQVVYIPAMENLAFHYRDMREGLMGAEWKYGAPIVKVYATLITTEGNASNNIDYVTSVFLKPVTEFSVRQDELKKLEKDKGWLVFQKIEGSTK